ncbi:PaaI family thioesterase [Ruegeria meonggei]|uniref:Thioesterase superfamily protein n=1 Tax=Ruegeria meonggei TaxID=1446476 RepID=A0A1X7A5D4_9RHOB|nr:PaaI family thioesterase [Ruegeria meonggei]SLN70963.1 Thioesterase superfamily protein [Ruegeria meonggei]
MSLVMNQEQLADYMENIFPQVHKDFVVEELNETSIVMRLLVRDAHLRPGGTVSGPSMFGLADVCVYAIILARKGRQALAVTTGCSMDFMRKPDGGNDMIARCTLLKLGRSLAVGDVLLYSEGSDKPVARATLTYSLPPEGSAAAEFG